MLSECSMELRSPRRGFSKVERSVRGEGVASPLKIRAKPAMQASFSLTHYGILIVYVLVSLVVGLWFARSQKSVEGYFLAERSAPWWAVAISINSSDTTAISYLGCAAIVFQGDLQLAIGTLAFPFAGLFVALLFVPFLARQKVFTVYEYLERRFSLGVRT